MTETRASSAQGTHGDGLGQTSGLIPQACRCGAALVIVCPNGCADSDAPPTRPGGPKRARLYAVRKCRWPDCSTLFTPTGPASKYCPAHQ